MSGSRFTIIEAPSSLGLFPGGVEMLPDALLGAGLAEGLGARRGPRLEDLPYTSVADRETGIRNASGIARYAARLADLITAARQNGDIPAFARVARPGLAGFWLHLDADVLDDAVMPAVDYRAPGGLSWDELESILRASMEMGRTVGIDVTIFNPRLDRDGSIARALSDSLVRGLAPS